VSNLAAFDVSVVVPVYNSAEILPHLVERLEPVLRSVAGRFELVLVEDGSRDASWQAVLQLEAKHDWVRGLGMSRNYGQHNALLCGIRSARHPVIVTMDDDLQNPPEEIPKLLRALHSDVDVVYGTPAREQHGLLRDLASIVTKFALQEAMGATTARSVSAFRAFRTRVRDAFADYSSSFVSIDVLLTWGTTRFAAIEVDHAPREIGQSNYTFKKLLVHALNMITGFSTAPLQLASWLGFSMTLFGTGVLCWTLLRYLMIGSPVAGFPFLASTIAIFSGSQMFALGIIGEYLARIHSRSLGRPSYVVRESPASNRSKPDPSEA
jgi:undecaprenyl-phosphate 4-deoxy-4-formamido-L-arabinose transferase